MCLLNTKFIKKVNYRKKYCDNPVEKVWQTDGQGKSGVPKSVQNLNIVKICLILLKPAKFRILFYMKTKFLMI